MRIYDIAAQYGCEGLLTYLTEKAETEQAAQFALNDLNGLLEEVWQKEAMDRLKRACQRLAADDLDAVADIAERMTATAKGGQ
jgi:hypothetical protein